MISVLLVDDHPAVTDGIRAVMERDPEIEVLDAVRTLEAAKAALAEASPDVAVVDIRLPDGSGLDLIERDSRTAFVLLSSFGSPQYVDAALRLGASGFFLKTSPSESLVAGVRRAAAGGTAFDPGVSRRSAGRRWHPLSERERDVVRLLMEGLSNGEIAAALGIASKTVEGHLGHLFERFGCVTRTDLALRAEREGWLDLPPR